MACRKEEKRSSDAVYHVSCLLILFSVYNYIFWMLYFFLYTRHLKNMKINKCNVKEGHHSFGRYNEIHEMIAHISPLAKKKQSKMYRQKSLAPRKI